MTVDERALADLRQLAERDAELAGRARLLDELDARVGDLRERAKAIDAIFAAYPAEETRLRDTLATARAELERRRNELAEAERELEHAHDEDSREHAQHAADRGRDHVQVALAALERASEEVDELERRAAALPDELPRLEATAREIAGQAPELPAPPAGLRDLVDWASHAHAELFVGAGHLATQRDRVIREANELATMLLGEPTYGSTVDQALARVVAICARG